MSEIIYRQKGLDANYKLLHTTGKNMIIFIEEGFGSIVTHEKSYPLSPGVLCFIGAHKHHYTMPENPDNYVRSKVFVSTKDLQKILSLFPFETTSLFSENGIIFSEIPRENSDFVKSLFSEINAEKEKPLYFNATLLSNYAKLLIEIHKYSKNTVASPSYFITRAIEYINANLTEEMDVDSICKKIHISKYHFCREFKKATGFTVMDYILKTRIVIAKNLLEQTKKSVSNISESCGFSSVSYFCRVFKKETEYSPLQYRKIKAG